MLHLDVVAPVNGQAATEISQFAPSSLVETNVYLYEQTQATWLKHTKRRKADMKNNKWFKVIGEAVLGLMILGFAVPSGQTATTVTLIAVVQDQQCQGG